MRFLLVAIICFINSLRLVKRKKKKRKEKNRKERKVVLIIRMASELSLAELRDVQVQLS
jgi:amino acid transporter